MRMLQQTSEHSKHIALVVCFNNKHKSDKLHDKHSLSGIVAKRFKRLCCGTQHLFQDLIRSVTSFPTVGGRDLVNMAHSGQWHHALLDSNLARGRTTRTHQRYVGSSAMDYQYVSALTNFDLATVRNYWLTSTPRTHCLPQTDTSMRGTVTTRLNRRVRSLQHSANKKKPMTS